MLAAGLLGAALVALAGCLHPATNSGGGGATSATEGDPLLGGGTPVGSATAAGGKSSGRTVPASATSASSTAALAAGTGKSRDPSGEIDPRTAPTDRGPASATSDGKSRGGSADTTLRGPEPIPGERTETTLPVTPPVRGASAISVADPSDSYQRAQQILASWHVVDQVLEQVDDHGTWKFTCAIPSETTTQGLATKRKYEATASGGNGLEAMRMVIQKIEQDLGPVGPRHAAEFDTLEPRNPR
jgi:hypothetical protein